MDRDSRLNYDLADVGPHDVHNPDAAPESSRIAVSRTVRFPSWSNFWELPVIGLVYVAHVRYRRYSPRRLPTFTSMRLPEIYACTATSTICVGLSDELEEEVLGDPDLHLIEHVARSIKTQLFADKVFMNKVEQCVTDDHWKVFADLRAVYRKHYRLQHPGILGNLSWWHNHIWHTKETWYKGAILWQWKFATPDANPIDIIPYFTHLANTLESEDDDFAYADYGLKAMIPFVVSIPFAMAARWTQLRAVFRPMNGLQRLLLWATIYPDTMQRYQHYSYLRGLRNKKVMADHLRKKLNLDRNIYRMVS
ncbi:hypothetical protein BC628DRAFT_1405177 [Trametes gibbosa]|nr:hypothetical protein BC628DRAFT_1405177 [Trametes gibbosa]